MTKSVFNRATAITLLLAAAATPILALPACPAPALKWETVDQSAPYTGEDVAVRVHDGYLYVTLASATRVKLFTILGQPVVDTTLGAGTSRLKLSSRGIYILKAGTVTKRITI